jgi:alanine racemase
LTLPQGPAASILAQVFGGEVELDEFAARSGTIGYHVLTSLGSRYARWRVGGRTAALSRK